MKRVAILILLGLVGCLIAMSCSQKQEPLTGPTIDTVLVDTVIRVDTIIHDSIIISYDTTFVLVHDTTYLPGDTVWVFHVDTLTLNHYDTTYIPVIIHDTVTVFQTDTIYVPVVLHDTVIVIEKDTVIVHDTLYVVNPCFKSCQSWELSLDNPYMTVQLTNPAGRYILVFDRTVVNQLPDSIQPVIRYGEEEFFFPPYGKRKCLVEVGPIDLPENAVLALQLKKPYVLGKTMCIKNLIGECFWGIKTKL